MELIFNFLERLYNTIRYNGFYILLSLLFPFIIYKFDAGREIIISMAENKFGLNIGLSILAFSILGLSVWCIPTLAIYVFQFFTNWRVKKPEDEVQNRTLRHCLYHQLVNVYNGDAIASEQCKAEYKEHKPQLPVRYFAVMPWVIFVATCLKVFSNNTIMIIGLAVIVAAIWLLDRNKQRVKGLFEACFKKKDNPYNNQFLLRYIVLSALYLVAIVVLVNLAHATESLRVLKWALSILNMVFLLLFYCFIIWLENSNFSNCYNKTKRIVDLPYRLSKVNYWFLLIVLMAAIIIFYYCNQYQLIGCISPIVIIVTMSAALIIFFELFFTSQLLLVYIVRQTTCADVDCHLIKYNSLCSDSKTRSLRFYRFAVLFAIAVVVNLYFFSSSNSHRIRIVEASGKKLIQATQRESLTGYFSKWFASRGIVNDDSVVYLISGQGGGSRAAAWFYMNMTSIQNRYPDFFKKVFSISTVSGSTTGANMFLATQYKDINVPDSSIKEKVCSLYGRNYMSSSFFGILLGDFIESKVDMREAFPRDRNYHLQKEELKAFEETFNIRGDDFFEQDYLAPYHQTKRHWPLFFINTTVVNFGTRAVFSPVNLEGFSIARDLYGEFKGNSCNRDENIPLVTCVNQSQAFPILSAYNYMDCIGRLGDGGISENSGCATTLEVYQKLRQYCDTSSMKHVKIICINLANGKLSSSFKVEYEPASIFNTLSAVVNSPFAGNETYAVKNIERQIGFLFNKDKVFSYTLDPSVTLTRTLSRQSVELMHRSMVSKPFELPR